MALVRCHDILVTRDANTIIPKQVTGWELPIFEELYGDVQITGEVVRDLTLPDPESEMARLTRIYGVEEESKTPIAEIVYGRSVNGLRQLKKAMEQSLEVEEKRGPGRPKKEEAA